MAEGPDTLRVSVVGGHDRVDLVVPAALRVADLVPELVLRLGHDDPLAAAERRLAVPGHPPLDPGSGLAEQGVDDGALLTLTRAADELAHPWPPDDDLTAVVAEAVVTVGSPAAGARWWAGLGVATALLGLGAAGAVVLGTPAAAVVSAAVSPALLAAAAVAARREAPAPVVTIAAWLAIAHAGAAGLVGGVVGAGFGWVVAGGMAAVATGRRSPLWAAPVAGVVLVVAGAVATLAPVPLEVALAWALVVVVVTGDAQPWLAATLAGLVAPPLGEDPPPAPDRAAVGAAVRRAHDLLLVAAVATGLLLVVAAPVVARRGAWGVALALLCCAVVALRSRRLRIGTAGVVGLVGAAVPLAPVAAAVWWQWPAWRLPSAAVAAGVGVLLLLVVALPPPRSARAGRLAELAEASALVVLPPALLAATGLLDVVRDLVG